MTLQLDLHTACPFISSHLSGLHLYLSEGHLVFPPDFDLIGYPNRKTAIKLCSLLSVAGLLNCPEARAGLPRSRSLGEGNSLCLGTGPFPLVSVKPGVKLRQERD